MPGRNAKPINLHLAGGNPSHLTKSEIEARKKTEIKTGTSKLKCPEFVKDDVTAYAKWKEIMKVYKDIDFVSSGDIGLLGRYCMTFSEYYKLLDRMKRIKDINRDSEDIENYIEDTEEFNRRIKQQLMDMVSTDGILRIETAINKKMDMLIKMEDRLFLNPLAKIKNIPKAPQEDLKENKFDKFKKGTG